MNGKCGLNWKYGLNWGELIEEKVLLKAGEWVSDGINDWEDGKRSLSTATVTQLAGSYTQIGMVTNYDIGQTYSWNSLPMPINIVGYNKLVVEIVGGHIPAYGVSGAYISDDASSYSNPDFRSIAIGTINPQVMEFDLTGRTNIYFGVRLAGKTALSPTIRIGKVTLKN